MQILILEGDLKFTWVSRVVQLLNLPWGNNLQDKITSLCCIIGRGKTGEREKNCKCLPLKKPVLSPLGHLAKVTVIYVAPWHPAKNLCLHKPIPVLIWKCSWDGRRWLKNILHELQIQPCFRTVQWRQKEMPLLFTLWMLSSDLSMVICTVLMSLLLPNHK